jgi:polygalacturonase
MVYIPWSKLTLSIVSRPIEIELEHATINFHGFMKFTDDIDYWVKHRIYLPFQNQSLAFVIKGHDYTIDGHNTGGIDGNGQKWYDWAKDEGNVYGRPMSFAISDSKDVVVQNWTVKNPAFWAQITVRSENIYMRDIYVNATSTNPAVSRLSTRGKPGAG